MKRILVQNDSNVCIIKMLTAEEENYYKLWIAKFREAKMKSIKLSKEAQESYDPYYLDNECYYEVQSVNAALVEATDALLSLGIKLDCGRYILHV